MRCLVILGLLAACSSAPPDRGQPTSPTVTAPMPLSDDPGKVEDRQPLQTGAPAKPSDEGGTVQYPDANGKPDGSQCLASIECASGVCEGQGCTNDKPGTCASKSRICTMDMRPYCGCDNKGFTSSSTCPGRRYMSRGDCSGGS
ncbi:MAG TPA: hypothetical protein VGM88_17000 [Kofleriaceae bacterium]|jgi:hypothetical protein